MKKVLVIDDEESMLELVPLILSEENMQVKVTPDCDLLEELLRVFPADLILMDIRLGEEDGREICKQLKSKPNPPIIILFTASDDLLKDYKTYLADGYISKPFDINEFKNTISNYLNNFTPASQGKEILK